jgi:diguanylate cyclase (GGDEF)-like protein
VSAPSRPAPNRFAFHRLLAVAALLAAANVLVLGALALRAAPSPLTRGWTLLAAALGACVAIAVPILALRQQRRAEAITAAAEAASRRQREVLDAMQSAVVLWGADDRLVSVNREFLQVYATIAPVMQPGVLFEDAMRATIDAGLVPEAQADPEAWLQRRMAWRRNPQGPLLREMPDGRWRRIVEQRLSDGSLLAHSVDVTELVAARNALAQAQQEAEQARQRLEDAVDALPAGFELYDAEDRLLLVNRTALAMYPQLAPLAGSRPRFEDVVRANYALGGMAEFAGPEDFEAWLAQRLAGRREPGEPHITAVTGERWVRVHERRTRDGGLVGVRIDVTEEVLGRAAAEHASQRMQDAIDALPEAFALYDADDRLVACNERYRQVYDRSAGLIHVGMRFEDILRHGLARGQFPQALGREEAWLAERLRAHRHPAGPVLQELPGNRWMRIDERPTRDGGIAGVRSDVTELVRREQALTALNQRLDELNAELSRLSETDALTGLPNRRLFDRRLAEECSRAARHGTALALLMLDVDHFKRYNDLHGHPAGDACLRRVAEALRSTARRPADLVARIGGEEFAVLLPHHGLEEARTQAERCAAAVDAAALPHGDSPVAAFVTLSIGGAQVAAPGASFSAAELLRAADAALYEAKQGGRHRVVVRS